jgi:hypothetical protein
MVERVFVRGAQDDARSMARFERFLPARRAQAPTITLLQSRDGVWREERHRVQALVTVIKSPPVRDSALNISAASGEQETPTALCAIGSVGTMHNAIS